MKTNKMLKGLILIYILAHPAWTLGAAPPATATSHPIFRWMNLEMTNEVLAEIGSGMDINGVYPVFPSSAWDGGIAVYTPLGWAADILSLPVLDLLTKCETDPFVPFPAPLGPKIPFDCAFRNRFKEGAEPCLSMLAGAMNARSADLATNCWRAALLRQGPPDDWKGKPLVLFVSERNHPNLARAKMLVEGEARMDEEIVAGTSFRNEAEKSVLVDLEEDCVKTFLSLLRDAVVRRRLESDFLPCTFDPPSETGDVPEDENPLEIHMPLLPSEFLEKFRGRRIVFLDIWHAVVPFYEDGPEFVAFCAFGGIKDETTFSIDACTTRRFVRTRWGAIGVF